MLFLDFHIDRGPRNTIEEAWEGLVVQRCFRLPPTPPSHPYTSMCTLLTHMQTCMHIRTHTLSCLTKDWQLLYSARTSAGSKVADPCKVPCIGYETGGGGSVGPAIFMQRTLSFLTLIHGEYCSAMKVSTVTNLAPYITAGAVQFGLTTTFL